MEAWYHPPLQNDPQPEGHMASYIERRKFLATLAGAAVAWPLAARAQQSQRVPRLGVLLPGTPTSFAPRTQAFVEGLRDLGYVEGRTIAIEWKWGQDRVDRLP